MADTLGWRMKLSVLVPSTNIAVQPEYGAMRPPGVTNHVRGFRIPNALTRTDADFERQLKNMRATMVDAMDEVLTLDPGHVILATAAESAGGVAGAKILWERLEAKSGGRVGVTLGADAIFAALARYGGIGRIGLVTPYMPVGDVQARRLFEDCGFAVVRIKGLRCGSPVLIPHTPGPALRERHRRGGQSGRERDRAGRHQPASGAGGGHSRVLAGQYQVPLTRTRTEGIRVRDPHNKVVRMLWLVLHSAKLAGARILLAVAKRANLLRRNARPSLPPTGNGGL